MADWATDFLSLFSSYPWTSVEGCLYFTHRSKRPTNPQPHPTTMSVTDYTPYCLAETLYDKVHALLVQGELRTGGRDVLGDLEALMSILAEEEDRNLG